ncbi:MAG TPA: tetratricopeptide repeat protein, partial [Pyrinomonadaceae bacterium]|nr:tetratricopeptide repeat protein [Pyrinomonadaceae bacterium]
MIPAEYIRRRRIVYILLLVTLLTLGGCRPENRLPARSTPEYNELVRTFYIGLAALQVGHDVQADGKLAQFTRLAPSEPAGWANWGLLAWRQKNFDPAAERLERARSLASENDNIQYLIGLLESSRGRTTEAVAALRKAVELNPNNLLAVYKLAEEVERQGDDQGATEFQNLMQKILAAQPDNLAALVELSRIAAKRGDAETLKSTVEKIKARSSGWPTEVTEQVTALDQATQSGDLRAAATRTSFLRNVLLRVPAYRTSLMAIKPPPGEEAVPLTHFLVLESPVFTNAAPDTALKFDPASRTTDPYYATPQATWVGALTLGATGAPVLASGTAEKINLNSGATIPFPGGPSKTEPSADSVLQIDFNYDFKVDLVLAGAGGVRVFRQESPSSFTDVTAQTKLAAS